MDTHLDVFREEARRRLDTKGLHDVVVDQVLFVRSQRAVTMSFTRGHEPYVAPDPAALGVLLGAKCHDATCGTPRLHHTVAVFDLKALVAGGAGWTTSLRVLAGAAVVAMALLTYSLL